MNRVYGLCGVLAVCAAMCGVCRAEEESKAAEAPAVELTQTYDDAQYGFSFQYPENWTKNESGIMGMRVFVFTEPVGGFAPNVNVVIVPKGMEIAAIKEEDITKPLGTVFRNIKMKKFEITKFAGEETLTLHYTAVMGENNRLELMQYSFNRGDKNITLTCTDTAKHFKQSLPAFEAITASFVLKELPADDGDDESDEE